MEEQKDTLFLRTNKRIMKASLREPRFYCCPLNVWLAQLWLPVCLLPTQWCRRQPNPPLSYLLSFPLCLSLLRPFSVILSVFPSSVCSVLLSVSVSSPCPGCFLGNIRHFYRWAGQMLVARTKTPIPQWTECRPLARHLSIPIGWLRHYSNLAPTSDSLSQKVCE